MSYIALARKWRPRTFYQLLGQEHIVKALVQSLKNNTLHHAYLFTGTRGVGKTSIARLLAKSMNCEQGISAEPCLSCGACKAIENGCFADLIEVDGASRTRVEDTRELLENVNYLPINGRFKIYLIDEVHMLSSHSSNALLKTLEEPPAHVKFLFATTDPQKLPLTILSRCLQFTLKPIAPQWIEQQLQIILDEQQQAYAPEALVLLAQAAQGSMRDALSLLDRILAGTEGKLNLSDIKSALGFTQQDYALHLLQAIADQNIERIIGTSRKIAAEGAHFQHALESLQQYLHEISLLQHLKPNHPLATATSELVTLSTTLTAEDVQLFYQIAIQGQEDMRLAPSEMIGFEMILLRMFAFRPHREHALPPLAHQHIVQPAKDDTSHTESPQTSVNLVNQTQPLNHPDDPTDSNYVWSHAISQAQLSGLAQTALQHAEFVNKSGALITLDVATGYASLFTPTTLARIETELSRLFQETIKIQLKLTKQTKQTPAQQKHERDSQKQQQLLEALQNDQFFQGLQQEFSAKIEKNSIASVQDDL